MRTLRARLLNASLGVGVTLFTHSAGAAPSARLVYLQDDGAKECPDEGALRSAVAARLGYDPFFPYATQTLLAEIRRTKDGFSGRVKLVDEKNVVRGARDLEHRGDRCEELVDMMALTMSIAIDPSSLALGRTEPTSDPSPPPEEPTRPSEAPAPQPAVDERPGEPPPRASAPPRSVSFGASLLGAGWWGAAPSPNVGVVTGAALRFAHAGLGLEGRFDAPASRDVAQGSVRTSFLGGSVVPCGHWRMLFGCLVATFGRLSGEGRGLAAPRTDAVVHVFVGPRFGALLPLSDRFDVRLQVDALWATAPRTLMIDGLEAYAMPRFSVGVAGGVGVRIF